MAEPLLLRYMQPLLAGRRSECFGLIHNALTDGQAAEAVMQQIVWPAMVQVDRLYRDDRINAVIENMACRINRTVAEHLRWHLPQKPANGKKALVLCAGSTPEEVGAQMVADLFQADGWDVYFVGSGVPHDEVLTSVGQLRPEVLLIFGTEPQVVPEIRRMIELIREVGVCPAMNIVVSGGIFERADGLWQEVGADLFAPSARELLEQANQLGPREPRTVRIGIVKKRRRRRRDSVQTAESTAPLRARLARC